MSVPYPDIIWAHWSLVNLWRYSSAKDAGTPWGGGGVSKGMPVGYNGMGCTLCSLFFWINVIYDFLGT